MRTKCSSICVGLVHGWAWEWEEWECFVSLGHGDRRNKEIAAKATEPIREDVRGSEDSLFVFRRIRQDCGHHRPIRGSCLFLWPTISTNLLFPIAALLLCLIELRVLCTGKLSFCFAKIQGVRIYNPNASFRVRSRTLGLGLGNDLKGLELYSG